MPHLILEHNIEDEEAVKYVCKKLHGCLAKQETVKLESIKTRSVFVSSLVVGTGTKTQNFAHLNLKLLMGRSEDLKNTISQNLLEVLKASLKNGVMSVEVNELENYSKDSI